MRAGIAAAMVIFTGLVTLNCDQSTPTQPSPPPSPPPAPAPIASQIDVYVLDVAWRPVEAASVEILNGSHTVATLLTDVAGRVSHSGMFVGPVTFRTTKDGYAPATVVEAVRSRVTAVVYLDSVGPSTRIDPGAYRLNFTAQEACTGLPEEFRTRTWAATITAGNQYGQSNRYRVSIPGTTHWLGGTGEFALGVSGNHIAVTEDTFGSFMERLPPHQRLEFGVGGSQVAETPTVSTLSFDGFMAYCDLNADPGGYFCQSVNRALVNTLVLCHGRLALTR